MTFVVRVRVLVLDYIVARSFQIIWNATTSTANTSSHLLIPWKNHSLPTQPLWQMADSG